MNFATPIFSRPKLAHADGAIARERNNPGRMIYRCGVYRATNNRGRMSHTFQERLFPTSQRRAFTLLEILLVILLFGLLLGLAWPQFWNTREAEQLPETARRMKALFSMCRAEAMNDARRYRLYFLQDGSVALRVQHDPIAAPEQYVELKRGWAGGEFVLEKVWVEGVQILPDGPPPVLVEDDVIEFTQLDGSPVSVTELEQPAELDFEPNGISGSIRIVMRDTRGRGIMMTLDGRLGRVQVDNVESVAAASVQRPAKLEQKEGESALSVAQSGAKKSP